VKRALDILLSAGGLLVLSPVLAGVALALRARRDGPVLFRQERVGRNFRPFRILKFRTMVLGADRMGPGITPGTDPRVTRLGAFLRMTKLDELPQLWNVLRGDMSLVGPRPLLVEYLPLYSPRQARRHDVRPGLTGLAQVAGRNLVDWEERFELDVQYVETRSLALDLRIIGQTVAAVLRREGISGEGEATMTPFRGSEPA
jgi:sugar transferase EpsL